MEDEFQTSWVPSPRLRQWMMWGALAAGVDVALSIGGLALGLVQEQPAEGMTTGDWLDTLVILPELIVLLALLGAAREIRSLALWRSSIGFFGTFWLYVPLFFLGEDDGGGQALTVGAVMIVGMIAMLVIVSRKPTVFSQVEPSTSAGDIPDSRDSGDFRMTGESPSAGKFDDQPDLPRITRRPKEREAAKKSWGCGSSIGVLILLRLLSRGLRNVNIDWGVAIPVAGFAVLLLATLVFAIWFGVAKIRASGKLGGMAAVSGMMDLLFVLGSLAAIAYLAATVLPEALDGVEFADDDPRIMIPTTAMTALEIGSKTMLALLLVAVWFREPDPWEAELQRGYPR